jgi:translation initiation factor 1A
MGKNFGAGGKSRRKGKKDGDGERYELIVKEEDQEYAIIQKMLGNERVEATDIQGIKRICHIRGRMKKKQWISVGDVVLIGIREFQNDKADIILKYSTDEARVLKKIGELPQNTKNNETEITIGEEENEPEECAFKFEDL